jgi:outer membrane lipoprotein-sorting protein
MMRLFIFSLIFMVMVPGYLCAITSEELSKLLKDRATQFDNTIQDLVMEVETILLKDGKEVGRSRSKVFRKGDKVRIESTMETPHEEGILSTMVYDGENAWILTPMGKAIKIEDIPKEQIDPTRFIPQDARILGEERIDDQVCYVVEYTEFRMAYKLWIERSRLIPLRMEIAPEGEEDIPPTIISFKDYRKVEGLWGLPYKTIVESSPHTKAISYIKRLEVNKGVDEALFEVKAQETEAITDILKEFGGFRQGGE